jgi:hypothetical protein
MPSGHRFWKILPGAAAALLTPVAGYAVYIGGYELFADIPRVHYPRVALGRDTWGAVTVQFTLNTPTVCAALMAAAGLVALYGAARILITAARRRPPVGRYYILQGAALALAFGAWVVWVLDFLGTAFSGVG